jgi:hypothetical protein
MKNIHILKTDKPTSLFIIEGKLYNYHKPQQCDGVDKINVNIYITSDEEIKEGDWILDLDLKKAIKADSLKVITSKKSKCWYYKKIILTTDELYIHNDLIPKEYNPFPQYIQKIDIEFLEWFVKNPSCEGVDVYNDKSVGYEYDHYSIIIPKEEPKQRLEKYSETFNK